MSEQANPFFEEMLKAIPQPQESAPYWPQDQDANCLSYWFPKLEDAGLPVPKTEIVSMSREAWEAMYQVFDGKPIGEAATPFLTSLRSAVERIGTPCFLRTGQGSGKHNWDECCNLQSVTVLENHVLSLLEWSEMVDWMGLRCDVWAVREFLPTIPRMVADRYGNMPVCKEFRFFVKDGDIQCWHPYWPKESLLQGMRCPPDDFERRYLQLCDLLEADRNRVFDLASRAGRAVGGEWSVDILETERGWYVTDMAIASRSFHWEGCEQGKGT